MFVNNTAVHPEPGVSKYQTNSTPITTRAGFDAARLAGARFEYTVMEDRYDAERGVGCGWIDTVIPHLWIEDIEAGATHHRLRAFYPVDSHQQYMAAAAAQRDEE